MKHKIYHFLEEPKTGNALLILLILWNVGVHYKII